MTPEELAVSVQQGDRDRLPELWEAVKPLAICRARRWLGGANGAGGATMEDLMQCGYIALLEAVKTFDPHKAYFPKHMSWYLLREYAACTDYYTKRKRLDPMNKAESLDDEREDKPVPVAVVEDFSERLIEDDTQIQVTRWLAAALSELPAIEREVINRRYYMGQRLTVISEALGVPYETTRRLEHRALRALRRSIHTRAIWLTLRGEPVFLEEAS